MREGAMRAIEREAEQAGLVHAAREDLAIFLGRAFAALVVPASHIEHICAIFGGEPCRHFSSVHWILHPWLVRIVLVQRQHTRAEPASDISGTCLPRLRGGVAERTETNQPERVPAGRVACRAIAAFGASSVTMRPRQAIMGCYVLV